MPSETEFLHAIIADPDADAPRLAYADWREDQGDAARAEFIRLQCALAALPSNEHNHLPLRDRELEILRFHHAEWEKSLLDQMQMSAVNMRPRRRNDLSTLLSPVYYRGFIEEITLDLATFLRKANLLGRLVPLRRLRTQCPPGADIAGLLAALAECPTLVNLRHLEIEVDCWPNRELDRLLACSHLNQLTSLSLIGRLDRSAVQILLRAGRVAQLESLELQRVGPSAIHEDLLAAGAIRNLQRFQISDAGLTAAMLPLTLTTEPFSQLRSLSLTQNPIGDFDAMEMLSWLPHSLSHWDLSSTKIGDETVARLVATPLLRRLRVLKLRQNNLGDLGAMILADSANLLSSTFVDLRNNRISRRVRKALHIRLGHHILV